jgi:hypothetical protein
VFARDGADVHVDKKISFTQVVANIFQCFFFILLAYYFAPLWSKFLRNALFLKNCFPTPTVCNFIFVLYLLAYAKFVTVGSNI